MSCGKKIFKTNLISAKPLPRLALAPFHGEVMKQQVWTARSTWVDKPPRSAAMPWTREASANYLSQKQPSRTVLTFHDSCVQPLNALLVKVANNSPPTKQAGEEIPVLSLSYYNWSNSLTGEKSPFTRDNGCPSRDTNPKIWMTCFIRSSRVCTKD